MAAIFQIGKVPASRWCALIDAYKKAVGYIRVSSAKQVKGESL
jgi:hypothetical protein